jgi:hypothetical protein
MQCHHIQPESNGGENTIENCIPLCLNCHADQSAYDDKHPIGNKYSSEELRRHRKNWYALVVGGATAQVLATAPNAVDVDVYENIKKRDLSSCIEYLEGRSFAGYSFSVDRLNPLLSYAASRNPHLEFADPDLECARVAFIESVSAFELLIAYQTFPTGHIGRNSVPSEWEHTQPDRFAATVADIAGSADRLETSYRSLIRLVRSRLRIS